MDRAFVHPGPWENTLWVSSEGAKLKSDNTAMSDTVKTLPLGMEVSVLRSRDRWHYIRTPAGEEGWMYRGRLSDTPPEMEAEGQGEDLFAGLGGNGIGSDEASTSRSIRGLSKETETYADHQNTPAKYRQALDQVLTMTISDKELQKFLKSGRIGEYAN
ncbi:MAG: SH3 domain-containing protein [Deltaproteobacteria bacterium]|nr:SH3 domain-containing protein [Deltaproteobacteria bacterium]